MSKHILNHVVVAAMKIINTVGQEIMAEMMNSIIVHCTIECPGLRDMQPSPGTFLLDWTLVFIIIVVILIPVVNTWARS